MKVNTSGFIGSILAAVSMVVIFAVSVCRGENAAAVVSCDALFELHAISKRLLPAHSRIMDLNKGIFKF